MIFGNIEGLVNGVGQVVWDREVTAGEGAQSSLSTGNILNGDEDGWYTIISFLVGPNTGSQIRLRLNNDSGANYGRRGIEANSTTVSNWSGTGEDNLVQVYCDTANYRGFGVTKMYAKSGAVRLTNTTWLRDVSGTTVTRLTTYGGVWNNTADNITNMTFYGNTGDIGVGSRIIILKSNNFTNGTPCGSITTPYIKGAWVRVGSQVLASPASSVTFSGLDGDRDVCYYLSVGMKTAAVAPTGEAVYLQFNSDTSNNYGQQRLTAESTTIAAARAASGTNMPLGYFAAGNYVQMNALWFAKSGFLRPLIAQSADRISGTTVNNIRISGQAWSNTASNLTSAVITSTGGSYLDTGTQVEIYALRPNG